MIRPPPISTLLPTTTLFRSQQLSAALKQSLQQMGINPSAVQVNAQGGGQNPGASSTSGQFLVTVTAAPAASVSGAPAAPAASPKTVAAAAMATVTNPDRTDVGGYNPLQYATDDTARQLANELGATVVKTGPAGGPANVPPQNMLEFGNGFVANEIGRASCRERV